MRTAINYTLGANVEDLAALGSGALILNGNGLDNLIVGNSAQNTLDGAAGVDLLVGGGGDDLYVIDNIADLSIELVGGGRDTVYTALSYYQIADNIEELAVTGSGGTYFIGNGLDNLIVGNTGNDTLDGRVGADFMVGGGGDDIFFVDDIADLTIESVGAGRDTIHTSMSYYQISENIEEAAIDGGPGSYVIGNGLDNLLVGNTGNDTLDGRGGADFMVGGQGDDIFFADNISDVIVELSGQGRDTIYTALNFYQMGDNIEEVSVTGGAGSTLIGNALGNLMVGNSAADSLNGAAGADRLTGEGGDDVFVFSAGQANGDIVTDFAGAGALAGDHFEFHGYGTAAGGATFTQLDATHWQITSADGLTVETITLLNAPNIDPTDFTFLP